MPRFIWESPHWPAMAGKMQPETASAINGLWDALGDMLAKADANTRKEFLIDRAGREISASQAIENIHVTPQLCSYCFRDVIGDGFSLEQYQALIANVLGRTDADPDNPGPLVDIMRDVPGAMFTPSDKLPEALPVWHEHLLHFGHNNEGVVGGEYRRRPVGVFGGGRCVYMAPPAERVEEEMGAFFDSIAQWAATNPSVPSDIVAFAGLTHLRFVDIHPFGDGNGRSARLFDLHCQSCMPGFTSPDGIPYSTAREIFNDRGAYYYVLQRVQGYQSGKTLDVGLFVEWHAQKVLRAMKDSIETLEH